MWWGYTEGRIMTKKQNCWILDVEAQYGYKVYFEKEVTLEEAVELFNQGEYEDVIDTEEYSAIATGSGY